MKLYRLGIHKKELQFSKKSLNEVTYKRKDELLENKCKIDKIDPNQWDISKKKNNSYEYIYTSSKRNHNICNIIPVSRSYFKLHEIIRDFQLLKNNIYCACLAEGPGGFIHCLNDYSKTNDILINNIYGITLISEDRRIPYWNQSILNNKKNIILFGKDKTGDLYKYKNIEDFISTINKNLCHLVTADGGFDYSDDYNSQEQSSYQLLYCEIFTALNIQSIGGNFVLKVFDLFHYKTIQLIYLLYCHYSYIEIYKPSTSRLSNSEKYIVCSNFLGLSKNIKGTLIEYFNTCDELHINVPKSFIQDINKMNDSFVDTQIKMINEVISYKSSDYTPSKEQISIAKRWCELYQLPINTKCIYLD
ncbi:MAG: hypothetical protein CL470_03890 [Acidimicrobiaceae bacterium]|nr:hypothetical protein [Acidimicrobiaceae bacterium]|tara:strand:- start:829 stop:1911 length:1083 start_codon:yes stop_codon:yes gene_type:complete